MSEASRRRRRWWAAAHGVVLVALAGWVLAPATDAAPLSRKDFGVALDPWQVDEWTAAVGAAPSMVMGFESFSRARTIDHHFAEARRQGVRSFMVTWEPWRPVDPSLGRAVERAVQPQFSNAAIARGDWDGYINEWARSVAASGLTVYIRLSHEMNGDWYPWSHDPAGYAAAWRRVVDIFRAESAAAKFVFSVNLNDWRTVADVMRSVGPYWPGDSYVDHLGATMIRFGGDRDTSVATFALRAELLRRSFGKEMIITELNTAAEDRVRWLTQVRVWLKRDAPWVVAVVLSQGRSRAKVVLGDQVGDMAWNVIDDPVTQPVVRSIITDMR